MVGIIILNYNNPEITINCFESIINYNTAACKYIFVDNASQDKSVEVLDNYFRQHFEDYHKYVEDDIVDSIPMISLITARRNAGYACGNNVGLKFVENDNQIDYVLILNNDVLFVDDIIPPMVNFYNSCNDAAIVSPLLLKKDGESIDYNCARRNVPVSSIILTYFSYLFSPLLNRLENRNRLKFNILENNANLLNNNVVEIELPSGSCMLIHKQLFKTIGYFDPRTFLYYEENILHKKVSAIGRKNYLLTQEKCIHLGATTTNNTVFSISQLKHVFNSATIYTNYYLQINGLQKTLLYFLQKLLILRKRIKKCVTNLRFAAIF